MRTFVAVPAMVVLLAACSGGDGKPSSAPAPTTTVVPASSSTSSTTTAPTSTTMTTLRVTTTAPALSPEATAKALFTAWTAADRTAAARVAQASAVDALFARRWQAADGWVFSECNGAAGSTICAWKRPNGEQVLMRVQNGTGGTPVTVAEVRFQA